MNTNIPIASIHFLLLLISLTIIIKGLKVYKEEKTEKFCIIIFLIFFIAFALDRLILLFIDLISYDSHELKSYIHEIFAVTCGACSILSIFSLVRFNECKYSFGKKQAVITLIASSFLSLIMIFESKDEKYTVNRIQREDSFNKRLTLQFEEKNYVFKLPINSGYKLTKEIFEAVFFADFTLKDRSGMYQYILISEVDEDSLKYTTEQYIESVLQVMKEKSENLQILDSQQILIDGVSGKCLIISTTAKELQRKLVINFLCKNGIYYQLTSYSSKQNCTFKKLKAQADNMAKNFSFIN